MPLKNVKISLSFDGTHFYGWQKQKDKTTVQEEIEKGIKKITGVETKITGCGRTDAGVHAINYVANFKIETRLTPEEIKNALNSVLPEEIFIKKVEFVEENFHSRYSAKRKTYLYLISNQKTPFLKNKSFYLKGNLDIDKMKKAAKYFIGKKDFSSFKAAGSSVKNPVREIFKITINKENFCLDPDVKILKIEIEGDGFLYKMARNIVGTLIEVGRGKIEPEEVKKIIEKKDRKFAPPTAPSCGLYLKEVKY